MSGLIRVWMTVFTITTEEGEEKTFPGPHIFAFDYNEAKYEADLLSSAAISVDKKITIEIVGELNEPTQQPIVH